MSVTVRMDKRVKAAIATIGEDMWTTIEYTDAVFDEATGRWVSRAEVAELPFTAFAAQKKAEQVPGRLVVRRIPDFNAEKNQAAGQDTLFDVWRFHAFFTTTDAAILDTVAADKTHRGHAVIAFNLTRAAASLTDPQIAKATTATIRRKLITVPARVATSAPDHPALTASLALGDRLDGTDRPSQRPAASPRGLTTQQPPLRDRGHHVDHPDIEVRRTITPSAIHSAATMRPSTSSWRNARHPSS